MTAKDKADELIMRFKVLLMDEDTDCGHEVLCTLIAIKAAKITVREVINANPLNSDQLSTIAYWNKVMNNLNSA